MTRMIGKAIVLAVLVSSSASAQWPPERLKNVKVLPSDISVRALLDTMSGFTRALGVRCSYCHTGGETVAFEKRDYASDSMPTKTKAREMLRMVTAIICLSSPIGAHPQSSSRAPRVIAASPNPGRCNRSC
jgi:hypothetical protein